ncbi:MAG: phytanoyl-CoA dioxygenase family protein [Alphaproteobacteria bacterium]
MVLDTAQRDRFWQDGYLVVEDVVPKSALNALNAELDGWIEDSRRHAKNFGETIDGKARFDLEPSHTAERPRLRRVSNPADVSAAYKSVLFDSAVTDIVADLIGPDVKFHHSKLNVKLGGSAQKVGWHQDHPYDPHTNDDVVVALLMLSDMTEANGCLRVVPGSHRGPKLSLYRGERYVGEIAPDRIAEIERASVPITGRAGSVCFQHTWTIHGSGANTTDRPRNLLICDYVAADAFPLTPTSVPSAFTGTIVRGKPTRVARLTAGTLELPSPYTNDSFFGLQAGETAAN